jgi:Clostripain family
MKKQKLYLLVIGILFLTFGVWSCSGGGGGSSSSSSSGSSSGRQWTYMVYMGADNTLSDAGLYNLNDMEKVGSSSSLAIVVQAEFSTQYTSGMPTSHTARIYVENDNDPSQPNLNTGTDIGNVDMANPASLTAFINWAKTTYPAQHYALVIWDHGAGWKAKKLGSVLKGAVEDDTSGTFMSLPDLAKGVADSGVHFDVINFDACLMAMYEVAYEFKGTADYLVFSEETEPGTGDPYDTILGAIAANPSLSGRTLATTIVDSYNSFYIPDTRESSTKSAFDMSQIDALDAKIVALAKALQSDSGATAAVQLAQANTQSYAYPANHDIYDFCQYLNSRVTGTAKTLTSDIMTMVGSVVVDSKYTGTDVSNSHGLAIYIPQPGQTNASDLTDYAKLKCNLTTRSSASGTWGSYVEALLGGASLQQTGAGNFALALVWTKPDGSACDADLDLYVAEPDESGVPHWYSPWMGQTSPNGFFSQESSQAGQSLEYYVANAQVMSGNYYFLANYYANGSTCTQAQAHLMYMDPVTVNGTWTELQGSPVLLDLTNPLPSPNPCADLACLNNYSDWWYPGYTTRLMTGGAFLTGLDLPINTRNSLLIFRNSRGSALNGITP